MSTIPPVQRLLAGPPPTAGPERLSAHRARLGDLPSPADRRDVIASLEASGLLGRGGAGFPVGRKWRALADRTGGDAVVLANGAEGEPGSAKDRALMTWRPHLVIDGALVAADAVGAGEIVFYVGGEHTAAIASIRRAIAEREPEVTRPMRLVEAPPTYVAGEATAAVHFVNDGDARPTTTPPRVSERGVGGRPTLVQNVESLAYAALIARHGDAWYRSAGRTATRGTALVTVTGAVHREGVREIEIGTPVGEVVAAAGQGREPVAAVLLGGYFGTWASPRDAWDLPLDPAAMKAAGMAFGCGIVGLMPADRCGVAATAEIMGYMADESAGQCGPCVFGLRSIGEATARIAAGAARDADLGDVERWAGLVAGRGACHHPDGAVGLLVSALAVFGDDFVQHARTGRCSAGRKRIHAA